MEMSGCQLSHSFDTVATMPPPCSPHKPPCSPQCSTMGGGRRARRQAAPQEEEGREDGVWEQEGGSSWEQDGSTLPPRSHCRSLSRASCTMRSTTLRRRREESGAGQCHAAGAGGHCAGTLASGQHCGQCGTLTFPRPPPWSAPPPPPPSSSLPHHDLGNLHRSDTAWR